MATRRERRAPRLAPVGTRAVDGTMEDHDKWRDATIEGDASGVVARALAITGCVLRNVRLTGADLEGLAISTSPSGGWPRGRRAVRLRVVGSRARGGRRR